MPMYQNDKKIKHIIRNGKRYSGKYFSNGNAYDTKGQTKNRIASLDTDKSRYNPGDNAKITVGADNLTGNDGNLWLELFDNFGLIVSKDIINFRAEKNNIVIESSLPVQYTDFVGYTLKATLNIGNMTNVATSAIDVSSDWTKYPRYAALSAWNKNPSFMKRSVENLNRLHINAAMYYDAYMRPQNPIPNVKTFKDWLDREIQVDTIKAAIETQHSHNQAAMLYNMIACTTGNPSDEDSNMQGNSNFKEIIRQDGTKGLESPYGFFRTYHNDTSIPSGTFDAPGEQQTVNMLSSFNDRSDVSHKVQYYYNPASTGWINYISNIMLQTLQKYNFDGWQGDTPGDLTGITYEDAKSGNYSNTFHLNSTLAYFADQVKQGALKDYKLSINSVGGIGQGKLDNSKADLMYSEIWPYPQDQTENPAPGFPTAQHMTYSDLSLTVNNTMYYANKSLIVPAYMYGSYTPQNNHFVNNAILLKDIVVFASGGDSMGLVDNMFQLTGPYYPDPVNTERIMMLPSLGDPETGLLRRIYDFVTAYEAILRNNEMVRDTSMVLVQDNYGRYIGSSTGDANKVWSLTRSSKNSSLRTLSLINFIGIDNINWQVNNSLDESQKANVKEQDALTVSYYTSAMISEVYMSSPDEPYNSIPQKLNFQYINGGIQFNIASLKYWDLIYMRYN